PMRAIRKCDLDRMVIPDSPIDVLAQQIVATCASTGLKSSVELRSTGQPGVSVPMWSVPTESVFAGEAPAPHDPGWAEDELFALVKRAYPYRNLSRELFDSILEMLSEGIAARRGRYGAYLHHDRVNHRLRARRGARLAAITSGGAIPETAVSTVVAETEGVVVGMLDEDFAKESNGGDIMMLGNTSGRI